MRSQQATFDHFAECGRRGAITGECSELHASLPLAMHVVAVAEVITPVSQLTHQPGCWSRDPHRLQQAANQVPGPS